MKQSPFYFFLVFSSLLMFNGVSVFGQQWSVEGGLYSGRVWRHTPKLTTRTGELLWAQELGIRLQTLGQSPWQVWHRYPDMGLSLSRFSLGEGSHGEAYGLLPSLTVPIVRRYSWAVHFRVGTGLAWVTRPYDYFDNPSQNAIGSHWNNYTQFKLYGEYRPGPWWRIAAGYSLNHFSNGSGALPNLGVNLPSAFISLSGQLKPLKKSDFQSVTASRRPAHRLGFQVQAGRATVEYAVIDGPKYPVWVFSAAGHFHFNQVNRALLGFDYENNVAVYRWAWHVGDFERRRDARQAAQRFALFVADEFLFGSIGVQLQTGYYVGRPINQFTFANWYSKLTSRYYLPPIGHTRLRPQVGVSLKAHKAVAEYIAFNVGFAY
ncbi:MAG: acyloxyacyl hydrolase [Saprospiraceae bacterium]